MARDQDAFLALGEVGELVAFGARQSERLFDQDVLSGLERCPRLPCMGRGGRPERNRLDLPCREDFREPRGRPAPRRRDPLVREEFVEARDATGARVAENGRFEARWLRVANGYELRAL